METPTETMPICIRERGIDEFPDADAVVCSPRVDQRHDRRLCGLDVAVVPGDGPVTLCTCPETDSVTVQRLAQLMEFDIVLNHRFDDARADRRPGSVDERLAELSTALGVDAVRVATEGFVDSVSEATSGPATG